MNPWVTRHATPKYGLLTPDLDEAELIHQEFTRYGGWQWPTDMGHQPTSNTKVGAFR